MFGDSPPACLPDRPAYLGMRPTLSPPDESYLDCLRPRAGLEHCQLFVFGRRFSAEPFRPFGLGKDDRHAVVQLSHHFIRLAGDDGAAQYRFALRRLPFRPEPGTICQSSAMAIA